MGDAIGKIIEALLELVQNNYKKPRLWIGFGFIMFCVILLFPYIDSNFFYFSRMEKRIDILEQVMKLDQTKINSNQVYKNEYESILQEIEQQNERTINSVMNKTNSFINNVLINGKEQGNPKMKFFTGAIWCILVTLYVPFMNTFNGNQEKVAAFIFMIVVSIVVGWICSLLPVIISPWVNYIGVPIVQLIIAIIFVAKDNKK